MWTNLYTGPKNQTNKTRCVRVNECMSAVTNMRAINKQNTRNNVAKIKTRAMENNRNEGHEIHVWWLQIPLVCILDNVNPLVGPSTPPQGLKVQITIAMLKTKQLLHLTFFIINSFTPGIKLQANKLKGCMEKGLSDI